METNLGWPLPANIDFALFSNERFILCSEGFKYKTNLIPAPTGYQFYWKLWKTLLEQMEI